MSWLLGYRNAQPPPDFGQYAQPPPASGSGGAGGGDQPPKGNVTKSQMDAYRFDSSALERAAAAAKELEKSGKNISMRFTIDSLSPVERVT